MSDAVSATLLEILLVEDNPGDVRLLRETFRNGKVGNRLSVVEDGVEALAFLRREGGRMTARRAPTSSCSI
jgi:chemotaxis family two-component system response regulator Rcp1